MSYWQHSPPEVSTRLVELAEMFAGCRAIYFDLVDVQHWQPAVGSAAASDQAALPPREDLADRTSIPAGFVRVADVVAAYLQIAAGHLGGLSALHAAEEVIFPSGMLTRGVIENCAHVFWLLGTGREAAPAKLARAYLEEDLSAEEAKKNAGRLGGKDSPTHKDAAAAWKQLRIEILARFPEATTEGLGQRELGGQKWLNPEKCVESMYAFLSHQTGTAIDARVGTGVYGYLSNLTHPTLYPVRELRRWVRHTSGDTEHASAVSELPIDFIERQASASVICFFDAVGYVTSYFGWPADEHSRMADLIHRTLPAAIKG